MQKITNHLWFDTQAKEAAKFYLSIFPNSSIENESQLNDTPSGAVDIVNINLSGSEFTLMSAGPLFKFNPSISFFVIFDNEAEINAAWDKLSEGSKELMPFQEYPWAHKYGWLEDKFGLSWQLSFSDNHKFTQKITPLIMFIGEHAGKTKEALDFYTSVFRDSKIDLVANYEKGEGDNDAFIKHAEFTLEGQHFMAMDSSFNHQFKLNEAISFMVHCKDQAELDYYWEKLSAVPESEQCGWLKDQFGVSWQIVPNTLNELMSKSTPEQMARVTQAFLQMKKFDLAKLQAAYDGK